VIKKFFSKTVCGHKNPKVRFVTAKDGTEVCDRTTGNIWEQNPDSAHQGTMTQPDAIAFCANLDKGDGKVYELPSIQQLVSVWDYRHFNPFLTPGVFTGVLPALYWSATGGAGGNSGWLNNGSVDVSDTATPHFVWCKRRDKAAHGY
jgi:hypothetical protein